MSFFDVIKLAGGLALFLFGMTTMGAGLEKLGGSKLEAIIKRLTSSTGKAVVAGAVLTAALQSSSATTVIVVGLVNSGIMQLSQAIGLIMGANIGTTVTAQILRLGDIKSDNFFLLLLKPSTIAPVFSVIGVALFMFAKSSKRKEIGQILVGFGVLFTGMFAMEAAVMPLRESPLFIEVFSTLSNPILGVLAGALVTAIIQSSSASVGILQALSATGIITWSTAVPIILGQNIGTCITPMLASIGASKGAKRAAFAHLYFNIIGAVVFTFGIYLLEYFFKMPFWLDFVSRGDIANFHTFFNLIVTLSFLPFTKQLATLTEKTVPNSKKYAEPVCDLPILDERLLVSPAVAIQQARSAVEIMALTAKNNFSKAMPLLNDYSAAKLIEINSAEDTIDRLEVLVGNYLIKVTDKELSDSDSHNVSMLLKMISEFERIGDYSINIAERASEMSSKGIAFSKSAMEEMNILNAAVSEVLQFANEAFATNSIIIADKIEPLEETIDEICEQLRERHIQRLKVGLCSIESGVIFLGLLTDIERISDHCSNVATRLMSAEYGSEGFDAHKLKKQLHDGSSQQYNDSLQRYKVKYLEKLGF